MISKEKLIVRISGFGKNSVSKFWKNKKLNVLDMGYTLYFADKSNMATCLEGVENEELQNYLRDYNATWFQGYYYSKPVPAEDFRRLLT